ncbi:MAG: hypothetical protein CMJ78_20915 [Planctomycetaceae bacterium]|nr:hypothetical protein [Planctomycetaceae bacterium]
MFLRRVQIVILCLTCVLTSKACLAETDAEFSQLFAKLMKAAEVGTDTTYRRLVARHGLRSSLTAPQRLRTLLNWQSSAGHHVRGDYRYEDGYIVLTWTGGFKVREEFEEAQPILLKKSKSLPFQQTPSPTLVHAKRLFDEQNRRSRPPTTMSFVRKSGDVVEEIVADTNGGLVGGNYESSILLHWCVACPFAGTPPSLAQLKKSCPDFEAQAVAERDIPLLKVVENQPVFETALRSQRHKKYTGVQGFKGFFNANLRKPFVAELIKLGFKVNKAYKLPSGNTQYMWHRYSDDTYANVITTDREGQVRLTYTPPRRKPRETVDVETLEFQNPSDRELFLTAHREIQRIAKKSWTIDPIGGWEDTDYFGRWFSIGRYENWMWSSLQYDRRPPGRGVQSIILTGSRDHTNNDSVRAINLQAKWCPPATGWSARIELNTQTLDHQIAGFLCLAHYEEKAENPAKILRVSLRSDAFGVTKTFGNTTYSIHSVVPHEAELDKLAKFPESFRDTIVGWIDGVTKKLEEGLESGKAVTSAFLVAQQKRPRPLLGAKAFAAIPPEPRPREPVIRKVSKRKLTAEEKMLVLKEATEFADARKKMLLENYEEMHRALIQAFPIGKLVAE